jgi:hypothetical protein
MPAVMTTRWPFSPKPSLAVIRVEWATISSMLATSWVWTLWTPQASARRRAVRASGVRQRIGTSGRSRAARRVVEPEVV